MLLSQDKHTVRVGGWFDDDDDGWCVFSVHTLCTHMMYKCEQYHNIYCILDLLSIVFCREFMLDGWMDGWVCVWACVCKMRDDANERTNERKYQRTTEGRKERYSFVICIICYVCLLECLPNLNRGCVSVSSKMRPKYCRKLAMRLSNCM